MQTKDPQLDVVTSNIASFSLEKAMESAVPSPSKSSSMHSPLCSSYSTGSSRTGVGSGVGSGVGAGVSSGVGSGVGVGSGAEQPHARSRTQRVKERILIRFISFKPSIFLFLRHYIARRLHAQGKRFDVVFHLCYIH